jgi:hypothetical protein
MKPDEYQNSKLLACHPQSDSEKIHRPIVAIGYKAKDGTIVVTDVLCGNFPDMTNHEMAKLSFALSEWSGKSTR